MGYQKSYFKGSQKPSLLNTHFLGLLNTHFFLADRMRGWGVFLLVPKFVSAIIYNHNLRSNVTGMDGAGFFPAGRGKGQNLRGGAGPGSKSPGRCGAKLEYIN